MGNLNPPADPHYHALANTDWRRLSPDLPIRHAINRRIHKPMYPKSYRPINVPISRGIYEPTNLPIGLSLSRLRLSAQGIYQPINAPSMQSIDFEAEYLTIDLLPYAL